MAVKRFAYHLCVFARQFSLGSSGRYMRTVPVGQRHSKRSSRHWRFRGACILAHNQQLLIICCALGLATAMPTCAQPASSQSTTANIDISAHVTEASQRFGLPESWIYAVMRTESAGKVAAVSHAGAMGLMQLMPRTWQRQRARLDLGTNPFDPRDNILAGTAYLREMYDSYGSPGFLAAYNAGPGRYQQWRDRGRSLPAETRAYVARIVPLLQAGGTDAAPARAIEAQSPVGSWADSALFPRRSDAPAASQLVPAHDAAKPAPTQARPSFGSIFVTVRTSKAQ